MLLKTFFVFYHHTLLDLCGSYVWVDIRSFAVVSDNNSEYGFEKGTFYFVPEALVNQAASDAACSQQGNRTDFLKCFH